jgi:two-component system, cell cycle response regulator
MKEVILLVDDNAELLEVIADELLEKYEVLPALSGLGALELLNENIIHLIITDVMMPGMDGFEFCRLIKSTIEYSHIPIILLTAKNTLQSKITGLELGADAYIEKPFEIEYLLAQVANLLSNRKKIKDHFAQSPVAHISSIAHTKSDEHFLNRLNEIINAHLADEELDVSKLAIWMNMSRTSLFRKIGSLSDLTPKEIINIARLKKAAALLMEGSFRVNEIADMVGYGSHTNFGRNFAKLFGMSPMEYQKMKRKGRQA